MITFIDANGMIGQRMLVREGSIKTTKEYLSVMDDVGISKTLVYHSAAKESDALFGNQLLDDETSKEDRFLKQWAVLPSIFGEFPTPHQLESRMREHQVTSVRLFPQTYGHSLKPYACKDLMDMLCSHQIPIFLDADQLPSFDALYEFCTDYPEARVVLCNPGYGCLRKLIPVMNACPHLYVESSTFLIHNGIETFCRHMGAKRMLFGSNAPIGSMAAAVSLIRYANISESEKTLIASQNLRNLLGEVTL